MPRCFYGITFFHWLWQYDEIFYEFGTNLLVYSDYSTVCADDAVNTFKTISQLESTNQINPINFVICPMLWLFAEFYAYCRVLASKMPIVDDYLTVTDFYFADEIVTLQSEVFVSRNEPHFANGGFSK